MKKYLLILTFAILAAITFVLTEAKTANALTPLTGECHWRNSAQIVCGENLQATDYYFNSAATKQYGQNKYAVFLDGGDSNPVAFVDITSDGNTVVLTDRVESIPNGAPNGIIDAANYNNQPSDLGNDVCSLHNPTDCTEHLDGPFDSDSRFNQPYGSDPPLPKDQLAKFLDQTVQGNANREAGNCGIKNALSFFLCPLKDAIAETLNGIVSFLKARLEIIPLNKQTGVQEGFDRFRTIANTLYVIIFLIIIFSNFISIGLDNYSIKKMLPRLLAAAIATQFGFFICGALIDLSNILLATLPSLVSPGADIGNAVAANFTDLAGQEGALGAIGGLAFLVIFVVIAAVAIVVTAIALAYLVFRNLFLIVLVFVSPLAFAAWVLPQTQQYAKKWATWFVKLLVMGPVVGLILASTVLVNQIFRTSGDTFLIFVSNFIPFIGFALIPKSLKWSADVMTKAGDAVKGSYVGKKAGESYKSGAAGNLAGKAASKAGKVLPGRAGAAAIRFGGKKQGAYRAAQKENYKDFSVGELENLAKKAKGPTKDNALAALESKRSELANKRVISSEEANTIKKINEIIAGQEYSFKKPGEAPIPEVWHPSQPGYSSVNAPVASQGGTGGQGGAGDPGTPGPTPEPVPPPAAPSGPGTPGTPGTTAAPGQPGGAPTPANPLPNNPAPPRGPRAAAATTAAAAGRARVAEENAREAASKQATDDAVARARSIIDDLNNQTDP